MKHYEVLISAGTLEDIKAALTGKDELRKRAAIYAVDRKLAAIYTIKAINKAKETSHGSV